MEANIVEAKVLTAKALTLRPTPLLPRGLPPEVLKGINTCAKPFQALMLCLDQMNSEAFCQDQLLLMANCKFDRDTAVRERVLAWWRERAASAAEVDRTAWLADLRADEENTRQRLVLAGPFDPTKVRFRTQLKGELADLQAWIAIVEGRPAPAAADAAGTASGGAPPSSGAA